MELHGPTSLLAPGAVLQDRYRIVRQLGKGGMGAVYEALDMRLDATVALKETFSAGDSLRRQFEREARLLAQLHHPALPRVSDYFTEGARAFLVMQFISGSDLAEIIARQPGPFPRRQVIAWADQLLDALIYLHTRDRQIIHRDIKPHNLKLTASGQIALLDFGLAKTQPADLSATDSSASIFGYTRRYSPLEQIQDQGTTPQSDIYALGATLYHLLTGVKPPDALARAAALVNSKPDPLGPAHEIYPAVGPEIAAILSRAMAQNPQDRYPTANDFREAIWKVGRRDIRAARMTTYVSTSQPATHSTVNTVVAKKAVSKVDPFDSYSILKPDDMAWLIPKPGRRPASITAALAVLIAAGVVMFWGQRYWFESWDAGSAKEASGAALVRQSKSVSPRANSSVVKDDPITPMSKASRKNDPQGRRTDRSDRANSNTNVVRPRSLKPPPIELGVEDSPSRRTIRNR